MDHVLDGQWVPWLVPSHIFVKGLIEVCVEDYECQATPGLLSLLPLQMSINSALIQTIS
jgi:hypothetical protein